MAVAAESFGGSRNARQPTAINPLSSATLLVGGTFFLSRSLFRSLIERWVGERARAVAFDNALGRQGWRIVLLMRVSPSRRSSSRPLESVVSRLSPRHVRLASGAVGLTS